jgi:hypothetical protein
MSANTPTPEPTGLIPYEPPQLPAVRVVVKLTPTLFSLLGLVPTMQCTPELHFGEKHYRLLKATQQYVLYVPI